MTEAVTTILVTPLWLTATTYWAAFVALHWLTGAFRNTNRGEIHQ